MYIFIKSLSSCIYQHVIIIVKTTKHYQCSGRNNETGLEASRKARAATAEWAAGVQPPPPTNPPLPSLIPKRVSLCVRRERERKAGNAHHPTQDQGQAGRRFAQQEESIPPEPKLPPKQSQSAKPSARCRPHISKKVYVRCQPEQAQVEGRPSNRQELYSSGQFVVGQSRQGASTESAIATLLNSSPDLLQTTLQSSNLQYHHVLIIVIIRDRLVTVILQYHHIIIITHYHRYNLSTTHALRHCY